MFKPAMCIDLNVGINYTRQGDKYSLCLVVIAYVKAFCELRGFNCGWQLMTSKLSVACLQHMPYTITSVYSYILYCITCNRWFVQKFFELLLSAAKYLFIQCCCYNKNAEINGLIQNKIFKTTIKDTETRLDFSLLNVLFVNMVQGDTVVNCFSWFYL